MSTTPIPEDERLEYEAAFLPGSFAQNVRQEMDAQGMTQQQLADRLGISQPALAQMLLYENVKLSTAARIAAALGKRLDATLVEFDR